MYAKLKYSTATVLESGDLLTKISVNDNEFWVRTAALSELEPKPAKTPKTAKVGVRHLSDETRARMSEAQYARQQREHEEVEVETSDEEMLS